MIQREITLWLIIAVLLVLVGACQFDNRDKIRSANATALAGESDGPKADATTDPRNINVYDLREGDCFIAPLIARGETAGFRDVDRVPCSSNSTYRVIQSFLISDPNKATSFPGSANLFDQAYRGCKSQDVVFVPTRESWSLGDRLVSCIEDYQSNRTNRTDWEPGVVFLVDSTADAADANPGDGACNDGAGRCTLRAAIMEANALTGADVITVPAGIYTLTLGSSLTIDADLTLGSAGAESTVIEALTSRGGADFSVFMINRGHVAISGVTVRHGGPDRGEGIFNQGNLAITNSTISSNIGSGIFTRGGNLALINSAVNNNSQIGIRAALGGKLTLVNTSVSNNSRHGIYKQAGDQTLTNSTVSRNSLNGIHLDGPHNTVHITNSTVSRNSRNGIDMQASQNTVEVTNSTISSNMGSGIKNTDGTIIIINTIITNHPSGGDCSGRVTSDGHNLDSDGTCNLTDPTDLPNADPLLGPLQDNGGPTETHALLFGSPAIDAGEDSAAPATDQRGVPRPRGSVYDIGAYEFP